MPVRKFRSVEEMGDRWYEPGDPALYEAMRRVWRLGHIVTSPRFPPGVHRHRSVESWNALTDAWAEANFRAYRRRFEAELRRLQAERT